MIVVAVGFVVGLIDRFLLPGKDPVEFIPTTLVGVGGSVVATYGGQAPGLYAPGNPAGFVGSVVGAVVLLAILRFLKRS